jgi:hypothetical protein
LTKWTTMFFEGSYEMYMLLLRVFKYKWCKSEVARACELKDWLTDIRCIGVFDFASPWQVIWVTPEFGSIETEMWLESFLRLWENIRELQNRWITNVSKRHESQGTVRKIKYGLCECTIRCFRCNRALQGNPGFQ